MGLEVIAFFLVIITEEDSRCYRLKDGISMIPLKKFHSMRIPFGINMFVNVLIFATMFCVFLYWGQMDREHIFWAIQPIPLIVSLLFYVIYCRKCKMVFGVFEIFFLLFIVICLVSTLYAINASASLSPLKRICFFFFICTLLHTYLSHERLLHLSFQVLCASSVALSVYLLLHYGVHAFMVGLLAGKRMGGELINSNSIALSALYGVFICFWYAYYKKQIWHYVPMLVCVVITLSTGSRKGLLGLAVGMCFLYVLQGQGKTRIRNIILLIGTLFLLYQILQLDMFLGTNRRFLTFTNFFTGQGEVDPSTAIRMQMIQAGFQAFGDSPLFGMGIGNGRFIARQAVHFDFYLHNNYIELLCAVGLIGTMVYYFLWFYPLCYLAAPAWHKDGEACVLFTLLACSLILQVGAVQYDSFVAMFLLLMAHIKVEQLRREQNGNSGTTPKN